MPLETKIEDFVGKIAKICALRPPPLKASSMIYLFCFQFFAFLCAHYKFPLLLLLLLGYKHDYSRAYLVLFSAATTTTTNGCLLAAELQSNFTAIVYLIRSIFIFHARSPVLSSFFFKKKHDCRLILGTRIAHRVLTCISYL